MLLVGLTGGIGSGKSTVAELLGRKGAVVVDADEVARAVVEPGEAGARRAGRALRRRHPRRRRSPRPARPRARSRSPTTTVAQGARRDHLAGDRRGVRAPDPTRRPTDAIVVCDVPLLVESGPRAARAYVGGDRGRGAARRCGSTASRSGACARDDAERRMAAQATDEERREVATHVLDNGGDLDALAASGRRRLGRPPDASLPSCGALRREQE